MKRLILLIILFILLVFPITSHAFDSAYSGAQVDAEIARGIGRNTTVGDPGSDAKLVTEQAVREALLTQEEVDDYVNLLIKDADSVHTRITITYDDINDAFDFVVDDMNDDVPDAGDFGAATDLDANGALNTGCVAGNELASTAVTPGSYTNTDLTVDADGRITAASSGISGGDIISEGNSNVEVIDAGTGEIDFDVDGTKRADIKSGGLYLSTGARINEFSTDGTFAGNSDTAIPTEKAVKTYGDANWSGGGGGWPSTITYVAPGSNTLSSAVTAASSGDILMLGSGTYSQSVPVAINTKSLTIRGAGKGKTIVAFSGCNGILITTGDESTLENFTIQTNGTTYYGLTVTGNDVTADKSREHIFRALEFRGSILYGERWARGIDLNFCWDTTFDNITIHGGDFVGYGFYSDFSVNIKVTNCYMDGLERGIFLSNVVAHGGHRSEGWAINTNTIIDCEYMVKSEGCVHIDVSHNMLDFVHRIGVDLDSNTHFGSVSDNWIGIATRPYTRTGVSLSGAQKISVSGNTITNTSMAYPVNGIIATGSKCSIVGNYIENQNAGIWLTDTSTYNAVVGNVCDDCSNCVLNTGANNDLGHNINIP